MATCLSQLADPKSAPHLASCEENSKSLVSSGSEFWETRYLKPVSTESAREIAGNLCGFFQTLAEWNKKDSDPYELAAKK